ncbi:MAG: ketose-bisphosphate aldolase [Eubacteriaceae bacterium]|nr:ketose-bisphosphate aldolase [Eubacteriaceae bacterium]MDD4507378.1 ketose-bisphosphate aldolase [Eubacteriaceae bacterium]
MPLVSSKEMFQKAYLGHYAIGAFNANNMEIIQGIVGAAQKEASPIILQVSNETRQYSNPAYLTKLIEAAVNTTDVAICLHLDHGANYEICKDCVDSGYTSVMIDGSNLAFEENITLTRRVVCYAHDHGVVVEGELGRLAGKKDDISISNQDATMTDPEQAAEFVERTGVDSLAIAIGTKHGPYKFEDTPRLDFDRLKKITALLPGFPLVLHGASSVPTEFVEMCNQYGGAIKRAQGVPEDMLRDAAKLGVCKINFETDLNLVMTACIRQFFVENPEQFDPRAYLGPGRAAIMAMAAHKMREVLGCSHK